MTKLNFTRFVVASLIVVLAVSACGRDNSPPGSVVSPSKDQGSDNWGKITNFSQSIEAVSLTFDVPTKTASLYFEHRWFDKFDENGAPYFNTVFALKGQLGADRSADLTDSRVLDYSAKIRCADDKCLRAELEIKKLNGAQAGTAIVKHSTVEGVRSFTGIGSGHNLSTTQARVAMALRADDPCTVNVTIKEVVGGLKNFFTITYKFSNQRRSTEDDGHFDWREASVGGEIGKNVLVRLVYGEAKGSMLSAHSSPYYADVTYVPETDFVAVLFRKDEGLLSLSAGR